MSADSPRRSVLKGAQVISAQPIVDRSIIDSVAGIINDIVPQSYTGAPNSDNKESISWARFEYADVNDIALFPEYNEGSSIPPLLLVLGYSTGVQVWLIGATGEATEVLSWRQGIVRTLRILPNPKISDENKDPFEKKRPMVALCDASGPGPQFCNINFISLKTGEQVKSIKFKNPVCDILANRRSIVVTFVEKIAVFDARTLDDVLSVTTCYASPGPNPNPVALGTRWLAYSEKKLLPARRSSGGCEGDGVQSYTATVLYAAKSLGKGLRGLGETVASSLTGNSVSPMIINNVTSDTTQPGVVTILDLQAAKHEKEMDDSSIEIVIAHFTAHSDPIVAMTFDLTGALLMTADKRGHDFHVFRIQPHPGGSTLAAVHHLYILHRGDTTAKVQDMVFSSDTRWAAVSTVRGTTHVFPVAPYGGPIGVRTHSTPHVVNRLSRFHRSAGLTDDGTRSHSPVSHTELPLSIYPYSNPRLPPYPHPTILHPLAQIRQPSSLNHGNGPSQPRSQQRQRLPSDDSGALPLKICACFAPPRAWIYSQRESSNKVAKRAIDSLFIMACHGNMIQYDLEPKPVAGVPKEKVCDDTMIELEVEAKGQWPLLRSPNSLEITPPLSPSSPLLNINTVPKHTPLDSVEDRWLSQVEIVTHAGPHRRLWMGPQFVFKTYNASGGIAVNLVEAEAIEIGVTGGSRPARSNPVNMPHAASRPLVPVVIDGSGSSYEQSPRFMEAYGDPLDSENMGIGSGENQLREDLAEAMLETSIAPHRAPGRRSVFERVGQPVTKVVNPLGTVITVSADEEEEDACSSQEFDSAEENMLPETSKSVCAEEGPASLNDLEPKSHTLRELTEICVEMRATDEPAIASVSDDNIREVKEQKALCVEMASTKDAIRNCSIDFEKEEAFKDVPSGLSLCAEPGEIPISPMSQAQENAWGRKLQVKCSEESEVREKNLAKAKYVVNYDEDSVVLMENRTIPSSSSEGNKKSHTKHAHDPPRSVKKSSKQGGAKSVDKPCPTKIDHHSKLNSGEFGKSTRVEKYVVEERGDSIVIQDLTRDEGTESHKITIDEHSKSPNEEAMELAEGIQEIEKIQLPDVFPRIGNTKISNKDVASKPFRGICETAIESSKIDVDSKENEPTDETIEYEPSCELSPPTIDKLRLVLNVSSSETAPVSSIDDFVGCSEYHLVEENDSYKNIDSISNQSDEDIEHINNAEASLKDATCGNISQKSKTSCMEYSPVTQRKSSKSTISDDDLEYINASELSETLEKIDAQSDEDVTNVDKLKQALPFDDDLEHLHHPNDPESTQTKESQIEGETEESIKPSNDEQTLKKLKRPKLGKEIVFIDSNETPDPSEVKIVIKAPDGPKTCKSSEEDVQQKDQGEPGSSNVGKSTKSKMSKTTVPRSMFVPKRTQASNIEIIDIDAMQKAEGATPSSSECKILSPRHETCGTRTKKSRRNRKVTITTVDQESPVADSPFPGRTSKLKMTELQEAAEEWQDTDESQCNPVTGISWSSIVKRKNEDPGFRKESELDRLVEDKESFELEDPWKEMDREESEAKEPALEILENLQSTLEKIDVQDETMLDENPSTVESSKELENDPIDKPGDNSISCSHDEGKIIHEDLPVSQTILRVSSKENSPEPEKKSDSEQEIVPERSSSSDDLNANVMPMDTEEDCSVVRDPAIERHPFNGTNPTSSNPSKKNNRSKKKKRR